MNNQADRSCYAESDTIHNAVGHPDEFNRKYPDGDNISRDNRDKLCILKIVFPDFSSHKTEGQGSSEHGDLQFF